MPEIGNIDLNKDLTAKMVIHKNLDQEIIVTSTDKVKIILREHIGTLKKKNNWINPISILATISATLCTTNFDQEVLNLKPDVWKAIFVILFFFSLGWSVVTAIQAINNYNKGSEIEFLSKLKAIDRK